MMRYIQNDNTDPYWNLALEQYVFDSLDRSFDYFILWRNDNAIVVGKYQNTVSEINADFVRERNIKVIRRLSGGGAVYHDLGNLNFTFITDSADETFDFSGFCVPVTKTLANLGISVEISGRNDMTIDGKKFSGNAQYVKGGRLLHHGTIMYDSDIQTLKSALSVSGDKILSKGIKSVESRVTNIKPYMKQNLSVIDLRDALCDYMFQTNKMIEYTLTEQDIQAIEALREEVYSQWSWNYGFSCAYSIKKQRYVEGCGNFEVYIDVCEDVIKQISFFGDFFGNGDSSELAAFLCGCRMEKSDLYNVLKDINVSHYFNNLDLNRLMEIILI